MIEEIQVEELTREEIYELLVQGRIDFREFDEWCDKQHSDSKHFALGGQ